MTKPVGYLIKGNDISAASLLEMFRLLTEREPTPEDAAEVRRCLKIFRDHRTDGRRPS